MVNSAIWFVDPWSLCMFVYSKYHCYWFDRVGPFSLNPHPCSKSTWFHYRLKSSPVNWQKAIYSFLPLFGVVLFFDSSESCYNIACVLWCFSFGFVVLRFRNAHKRLRQWLNRKMVTRFHVKISLILRFFNSFSFPTSGTLSFPDSAIFFPISDICARFVRDYSDFKTRRIFQLLYFWIRIFLHCIPFVSSTWVFFTISPNQILTSFFRFSAFLLYKLLTIRLRFLSMPWYIHYEFRPRSTRNVFD